MNAIERAQLERKKASEFPQGLLDLLDSYVHGVIGRREFMARAQKFAIGAVSAAALVEMLKPNYAWAIQVPEDDKAHQGRTGHSPLAQRQRPYRLLSGAARQCARQSYRRCWWCMKIAASIRM